MAEILAGTLFLTVLVAPLVFGLQRFGLFRPKLWQVLLACCIGATLVQMKAGVRSAEIIGRWVGVPLLMVGLVVLVASFLVKGREKDDD